MAAALFPVIIVLYSDNNMFYYMQVEYHVLITSASEFLDKNRSVKTSTPLSKFSAITKLYSDNNTI